MFLPSQKGKSAALCCKTHRGPTVIVSLLLKAPWVQGLAGLCVMPAARQIWQKLLEDSLLSSSKGQKKERVNQEQRPNVRSRNKLQGVRSHTHNPLYH